ncbi:MAG: nitrate reductase molybdenum cofactor assembly chaperone [Aquabacterium sp.]|jgi:nitrate reductase delta subunit|uniref:nitrate reductase molybdenum cofactor assembly chaperone n=1 Tax=Aquabacterium sp. TaxID=1872578 RepID=UPI001B626298|nr:nitrate reductase molybdenum cofactor assembly chaperone [Aquabacterium sp.]MBP7131658.1 nitrate reductase molybdenum cofactor assembly chaperone [Aquabacterium sp.]MBP9062253.1 nitrate reductase molybdenum cofactor assembly chaperone [Aquabacterium sp.]MDQ5925695.1 Nitrate reductase molybdenum cofactor assembly chaperone [Pseudomonadota bacterium]
MTAVPERQLGVAPTYTLRALAHLLSYPGAELRALVPELKKVLADDGVLSKQRMLGLNKLLDSLVQRDPFAVEEDYVEMFDRGRATSLHLFEHVHGDSRDRGPAMIDLVKTYEQAGMMLDPTKVGGELPDYLPVVMEFLSTLPVAQMRDFIGEIAHILNSVHTSLVKRQTLYAHVLAALLEVGHQDIETVAVVAEEDLDASWAEPEAFAGCSSKGQQSPDQPQPIQIVRRTASTPQRGAPA